MKAKYNNPMSHEKQPRSQSFLPFWYKEAARSPGNEVATKKSIFIIILTYFPFFNKNYAGTVLDCNRFINGNRINRISDSEPQGLKTNWGLMVIT